MTPLTPYPRKAKHWWEFSGERLRQAQQREIDEARPKVSVAQAVANCAKHKLAAELNVAAKVRNGI